MTRPRPAALAAAALATCTLAACTSGGGEAAEEAAVPQPTTSVPAATQDVDTVTWNVPSGEPPVLDPAHAAIDSVSTIVANMCESLFTFGPDYEREPALATELHQPDPLTYVFDLREDAEFWNGDPVTAEDVVYSVERVLDPALGSPWAGWAARLDGVEATGDHEVTVTMAEPDVLVPNFFATPAFHVVQKDFAESAGSDFGTASGGLMCTGPYRFDHWSQGEEITLVRHDEWWNTEARARVETLRFTFVTDPYAQAAALNSGDADGQFAVPRAAHDQLAERGSMLYGESLAPTFLAVIDQEGALADPATRRALQSVVDYQGIVDSVYQGAAQPLRALVPPAAWGYAEDEYQRAYDDLPAPVQDIEAALEQAGRSSTSEETIVLAYTTAIEEETRIATAIADAAAQASLHVELRPLTAEQFGAVFSSEQAREGIDVFLTTGYLDFPEPLAYYQYFTTGSFYNFSGYSNEEYDAAVAAAMAEPDPAARAQEVVRAQAIMAEDLVTIPVATQYVNAYYGPDLAGLVPRQNNLYTPWAVELGGR